jgi:hypothetical protein
MSSEHNRTWCDTGTNEESAAHHTGKSQGLNSGLPQEAEVESDQLLLIRLLLVTTFWEETISLRFREWGRSTVLCECVCECVSLKHI